jgi:glycosyltransferase involved in cell wall biosynthesis
VTLERVQRLLWLGRRRVQEPFRSHFDVGPLVRRQFRQERETPEYQGAYDKRDPLVSVCVATYNRAELLTSRALPSLLSQTYRNLQIIVVGDGCTDDTAARIASLTDSRILFVNLPKRGDYPDDPHLRWMVAGTAPLNHALSLAKGDFITHLDDDDEHAAGRIETLVRFIQDRQADLVFHPFEVETVSGEWLLNKASAFDLGQVTTSSVLYHSWFRQLGWDPLAYRYGEPGDWNRFRKLKYLGARAERHDGALLKHYREGNQ